MRWDRTTTVAHGRGIGLVQASPGLRLSDVVITLSIALLFGCSGMLLTHLGFNYGSTGGGVLDKIHPGTFMAGLALLILIVRKGVWRFAEDLHRHHAPIFVAAAAFGIFTVYIIIALARPFTFVVETLLLPTIMFMLLADADERLLARLSLMIHAFMGFNAVIAIIEFVTGWRLVPFYLQEGAITWDWRSTAMLGHPLANANLTGVYIILLASLSRALPDGFRLPMLLLQLAAMATFGGRAATAATFLVVIAFGVYNGFGVLLGRRIPLNKVIGALVLVPLLAAGVFALAQAGFFDRFADRVADDQGSAETRVVIFDLFQYFRWEDLILGPNADQLATLMQIYGLDYGIESFIMAYILQYGVAAATLVFAGIAFLCVAIAQERGWRAALGLAFFLGVNATSTGISTKTTIFGLTVIMLMTTLPRSNLRQVIEAQRRRGSYHVSANA